MCGHATTYYLQNDPGGEEKGDSPIKILLNLGKSIQKLLTMW